MRLTLLPLSRPFLRRSPSAARAIVPPRRRARAALLVGLATFIAAQLGMGVAVETVKPEWRDPEYGHRIHQLRELPANHPDRPLVVAVGSSRTLMGLDPLAMGFADELGSPLVYNFGQTGAGPLQILLTAFRILDDGVKPAALLIELFPAALVGDGSAEDLLQTWQTRFNRGDVARLASYTRNPQSLSRMWLSQRIAPWHSLRFPLLNHWKADWLPTSHRLDFQWAGLDSRGWLRYPAESVPAADRARRLAEAGASYREQLANYRIGATSDRALRDIASRCRRDGIRAAFYLMPEGPAFASWYPPGVFEAFQAYAERLSSETGVPLFDASKGFSEEEFADSHHLLPGGAARFSRKLADECLRGWNAFPSGRN
ncbi:MAG TPA: hypothetical protein VN641_00070 [Urbifossiella sp.]|nr:hypothetical protein [Urbifossiella sp.]